MQIFPSQNEHTVSPPEFYSLRAILTFVLLPPLWCLSIPALVFSSEAKKQHLLGNFDLAYDYSEKTKRFIASAWTIFAILLAMIIALYIISHLSLL